MHWDISNLQTKPGCPKEQIEISKRIKVAEIFPLRSKSIVIFCPHSLCAAECVSDGLSN